MTAPRRIAGRYRMLEVVEKGASGTVWAAHDDRTGQHVAVRLLGHGLDDRRRVAHFLDSARAVARLEHPGLARVLDCGQYKDVPYIVTEWIDGAPLSCWRGQPTPWGFVQPLMLRLLEALSFVHSRELLHQNLTPRSLYVLPGPNGPEVRIVGVGCARLEHQWSDRAVGAKATLKHLGSLRYMAPEVAEAPSWKTGPWSDLYSVGLILYELLTGQVPFSNLRGVALLIHRAEVASLPLPPEIGAPYHDNLEALLRRLLARDPIERPQSAIQVRNTIEAMSVEARWFAPNRLQDVRFPGFDVRQVRGAGYPLLPLHSGPIAGRNGALRTAWKQVQAVVSGFESRLVLIEGPLGIGKSRLANYLADRTRELGSARVWRVRNMPGSPPGAGLIGALEDALRATSTDAEGIVHRVRALPLLLGVSEPALETILPALLRPDPTPFARPGHESAPGAEIGSLGTAHMVAGTFLGLLERIAWCEAVVLLIDDLHWASEPEGPDLIRRVLAATNLPVCVVATIDPDEPSAAAIKARFPESARITHIQLRRLDDRSVRAYLGARVDLAPEDTERLVEAAAGRPMMLRGLTDLLLTGGYLVATEQGNRIATAAPLADTIDGLFAEQLARLPATGPDTLVPDVVQGLALGRLPLSPPMLLVFERMDPHRPWRRALAAAEQAGLMEHTPAGRWVFRYETLRQWLGAAGFARAESWHRRWLKALATLEAEGRGRYGVERSEHALAIGETALAVRALLEAATWALGPGQHALERGLRAARRAGAIAGQDDLECAVRALRLEAELLRQAGDAQGARACLDRAASRLARVPDSTEHAWCRLTEAWLQVDAARLEAAEEAFEDASRRFHALGDRGGVLWANLGAATVASRRGQHWEARSLAREVEELFEQMGGTRGVLAARLLRGGAADAAGDWVKAEQRYRKLQEISDARRWLIDSVTLRLRRARVAIAARRAHDALRLLDEAQDLGTFLRLARMCEWIAAVRPAALAAAGAGTDATAALAAAPLPNPRLCPSAARAVRAALEHPTTRLDVSLHQALGGWADRLEAEAAGGTTLTDRRRQARHPADLAGPD